MFDGASRKAISDIARRMGVEPSALLAVAEIESAGKPFARVNGKPMPLIRWEGHYFYRLLPDNLRAEGVKAGLASPSAGKVGNPASQEARYAMLERGRAIHEEAAFSSCSWGLGQVMGSHWKSLGYGSVQQFVKTACSGVAGQTELMARFIQRNGLAGHLKQRNWRAFAHSYNGPAYKTNRYDEKMARAYIRYLSGKPPPGILSPLLTEYAPSLDALPPRQEEQIFLKPGASGPAVKELQQALKRQGFFVYVDGNYGTSTQKAVMEFQRKNGLNPDGRVNTATRDRLTSAQTDTVAPWWSKRSGGGGTGLGASGGGGQQPAAPPRAAPKQWWEPSREAMPQQAGKKVWWDV